MKFTKETLKRTARTFLQSAVGYIIAHIVLIDFTDLSLVKSALLGLVVSAGAAGLAAIMNLESEGYNESNLH